MSFFRALNQFLHRLAPDRAPAAPPGAPAAPTPPAPGPGGPFDEAPSQAYGSSVQPPPPPKPPVTPLAPIPAPPVQAAKAAKMGKMGKMAKAGQGHMAGKGAGALLAAAAMSGPAGAAPGPEASAAPAGLRQDSLVYKSGKSGELHLEVVRPVGDPPAGGRACVVFFHGGGWRRGQPHQFIPFSQLLARHGVIGMSAEYRLMDEDQQLPLEAIADARSALRWVRAHAQRLGCDPQRIGAGGGSAGGHLALMTAMKGVPDDPADDRSVDPRPGALILLNTPLNFDDYPSPVPQAERRKVSPWHLMDASLPPALIMHGTKDKVVPWSQVLQFKDKAASLGQRDLTVVPFDGRGHGFFNRGKGQPGDHEQVGEQMLQFLRHLGWVAPGA